MNLGPLLDDALVKSSNFPPLRQSRDLWRSFNGFLQSMQLVIRVVGGQIFDTA